MCRLAHFRLLALVGAFLLPAAVARASVIQTGTSFQTIYDYGLMLRTNGLLGYHAITQSGGNLYGSAVFAQYSDGTAREIVAPPRSWQLDPTWRVQPGNACWRRGYAAAWTCGGWARLRSNSASVGL